MMRKPTWRSVIICAGVGLAAYVLFLVVLAPATLIDTGLRHATDGKLRLAQAHGTLWSGSGQLEIVNAAARGGVSKELAWSLQPASLWRGRLDFDVAMDHASSRFPLRLSLHGINLTNVEFSLPASALGVAVPRIAPLGPRGELVFHIAKLSGAGNNVAVDALMTWKDASSALTTVAPLGTYELRVNGAAGTVNAVLRTSSGPLHLEGNGSVHGNGPLAFSATARVDAQHRAQLTPLLRLIAIERSNGDFALQFHPPLGSAPAARPANP